MAKRYGSVAEGAIDEVVEAVVKRLHPEVYAAQFDRSNDPGPKVAKLLLLFVVVGFIAFIGLLCILTGSWLRWPIFIGDAIIFVVGYKSITPHDPQLEKRKKAAMEAAVNDAKRVAGEEFYKIENGKIPEPSQLTTDEQRWLTGAWGEIEVSKMLEQGLDDEYSLVEDITIHKNGHESANIDHLTISPRGLLLIDSKVWGDKLKPATTGDFTYLPKNTPYWETVSTCLYEASCLPTRPRAVIMAVGGEAEKRNKLPMALNAHIDRYDQTGSIMVSPMPTYLVPMSQIAAYVDALDKKLPVGPTTTFEKLNGASFTRY